MSSETKYYCMTEAIALYLQKYILYRKRKVFFGDGTMQGLFEVISKHRDNERYLLLVSDNYKGEISEFMRRQQYQFAEAVIFKTVPVQLKEKEIRKYDMIVFFSAAGVHALKSNIPNFRQRQIYFGAFGPFTSQAVLESGYRLHINAPAPATPSMAMAIDLFLGNGESIK
jgi:uroporphyrinogen-III synthase